MKKRIALLAVLMLLTFAGFAHAWDGWTWTEGRDGVRVYYPSTGWTWTEGSDGRRVVYPLTGWTWTEGRNGRRVAYPLNNWTWTEGRDGRRIVYPLVSWTWTEGRDGCRVIYPLDGWTWTEGRDGRRIVYPLNGWSWREDQNGRRYAYQLDGNPWANVEDLLYGLLVSRIPLTDELRPHSYLLLAQMGIQYHAGSSDPELYRAHDLLNNNNIHAARDLFRSLARSSALEYVRREASYMSGYCSANLQDYWQALNEYRDFLAIYDLPGNWHLVPEALYVTGVINEHLGRKSDAAASYRSCVERFPQTQMADQSQERLKAIGYRTMAPAIFSEIGNSAPRRNPFEVFRVDRGRIARVAQFIHAVERMEGIAEARARLNAEDLKLETVQKYQRLLAEKEKFERLHQEQK